MNSLNQVFLGDCLEVLKTLPDESLDSCVSDVPYGLGDHEPTPEELLAYMQGSRLNTGGDFQNNDWEIPSVEVWKEVYRVLKPGAYVLAFGGTRTYDLISMGLRMAGFEMRDSIASHHPGLLWVQSQGMPKSRDALKTDLKPKIVEQLRSQGVTGDITWGTIGEGAVSYSIRLFDVEFEIRGANGLFELPDNLKKLEGCGTGLKPTWEPIIVTRKPLNGSLSQNVVAYGTGLYNIDGCRVKHANAKDFNEHKKQVDNIKTRGGVRGNSWKNSSDLSGANDVRIEGRWPTNVVLTHAPECKCVGTVKVKAPVINRFDDGAKVFGGGAGHPFTSIQTGDENGMEDIAVWECVDGCPAKEINLQKGYTSNGESNKVSKFYPQFEGQTLIDTPFFYSSKAGKDTTLNGRITNDHPTRKPVGLMRWCVRLVTPPGGTVLDPYCGSGGTLHGAILEGFTFIGIEKDPKHHKTSTERTQLVLEDTSKNSENQSALDSFMEE